MKKFSLILFFTLLFLSLSAQDLEQLNKTPLKVSGNVAIGSSFYHAEGRDNRRSPYSYFISANPTFTLFGFDIPVSLVYRDQQGSISNPFNRVSVNPRYKWISLHAGSVTMNLSPYTLSGQIIKGGGVELTPGKFRISAIGGTMQNPLAQLDTIVVGAEILPNFKRTAFGGKIGFGSSRNYVDLIAFKAKDDINSLDPSLVDPRVTKPEENLVAGTSFKISPTKWVSLRVNASASAHTANQSSGEYLESNDLRQLREDYGNALTINLSTKLQFAGDANLDFKFKNFGFGGEYKRVDPFYKSLGTFYFQEDYENMLIKVNFRLLKNKLRFTGRGGLQRNNLNNLRSVTNTRQIFNTSLSFTPSKNFQLTGRYSNFQTERSPGLVAVNDTLRYARATALYGITPRFSFGSDDRRSSITLSANYQNLEDILQDEDTGNGIENYNGNLSYSLNMKPSQSNFTISLLANQNLIKDNERQRLGANLRFSKKLFDKKLTLSIATGAFQNYLNAVDEGQSFTGRLGVRYKINKTINLSSNINYLNRMGTQNYQEYRANVRLSYALPTKSTASVNEKTKNNKIIKKNKS